MSNNQKNKSVEPSGVPEITKGEWKISEDNDIIVNNGNSITVIAEIDCNYNANWEANAEAICNAVNNTYGKGINPEAVPDLVEVLKSLSIYNDREIRYGCASDALKYNKLIKDVLKKAEIKK
jgi:hypothetical protein